MSRSVIPIVVCILTARVALAQEPLVLKGHAGWIGAVAFSPDGLTLATGSADNTIKLWQAEAGKELATLKGHGDYVVSLAFSPDGRTLASGSFDHTVRLWDLATGKEKQVLRGHQGVVGAVAFSPDGATLATGSVDSRIKLWDVTAGQEKSAILGHKSWVNTLAFIDGQSLVSGSSDGTVKVWDRAGQERASFDVRTGEVRSLSLSPDRKTVAAGVRYGTIRVLSLPALTEVKAWKGHISDVWGIAFHPDGKLLASGNGDWNQPGEVKLWDTATWNELRTLQHSGEVLCVAIDPHGRRLAAGSWDKTVRVWPLSGVPRKP